jgi:hypothetical protein
MRASVVVKDVQYISALSQSSKCPVFIFLLLVSAIMDLHQVYYSFALTLCCSALLHWELNDGFYSIQSNRANTIMFKRIWQ